MEKYTIDSKMTFNVEPLKEGQRCRSGYVRVRRMVLNQQVPEMSIVDGVFHETV